MRRTLAALALLVAAGCRGPAPAEEPVPVREADTPVENRLGWPAERCAVVALPAVLPSVDRLSDSVSLRDMSSHAGPLSFGIAVTPRGDVESVRLLLAETMNPEGRRDLEDRIFALLQKQEPSAAHWTVRLNRSEAGAWTVERSVYCAPRVAQMPGFSRFYGTPRPRGINSVEVRVSVTESGFGQSVQLPNPPANRDLDATLRQQAMTLRFLPAMLNGEPVPSVFTYYVTIRRSGVFRR